MMLLYLAINYLEQSVTEKRNLLSRCLITVPQHLDHGEPYLHRGKLPSDKYRFPWKRVNKFSAKVDDDLFIDECASAVNDASSLVKGIKVQKIELEDFSSTPQIPECFAELVNFNIDCDVVPSSNPSTTELFTPDDFFSEQNLFQETFEKEDLQSYSWDGGSLKIENIESTYDILSACDKAVPDLYKMVSGLKPESVEDPLLQADDAAFKDYKKCSGLEYQAEVPILCTDVLMEKFDVLLAEENKGELEDVLTDNLDLHSDAELLKVKLLNTVITEPKSVLLFDDEPDIKKHFTREFGKDLVAIPGIEKIEVTQMPPISTTFVGINEIIVTNQDIFCEKALLDTPLTHNNPFDDEGYRQKNLQKLERKVIAMPMNEIILLNCEEKQAFIHRAWQMEKYCDEIQGSRLPEPEEKFQLFKRKHWLKPLGRFCNLVPDTTVASSELNLSWEIVKFGVAIEDPCRYVGKMDGEAFVSDLKRTKEEEVETYSTVKLYREKQTDVCLKPVEKANACQVLSNRKVSTTLDQLGEFMALRAKDVTVRKDMNTQELNKNKCLAEKNENTSESKLVSTTTDMDEKIARLKQNLDCKKRVKHHVVKVWLTDELREVVELLESSSEQCLLKLKQTDQISRGSTFQTINPDSSRFLLKQREKYLTDRGLNTTCDEVYKAIVTLHGLVGAAEIAVNCCLDSAMGYLGAFQEKFSDILGASLDDIRQKLFEKKTSYNERNIFHPKIVTLCKETETWIKKKRAKSKDHEQKILILVKRDMPSLLRCLKNAIELSNLFQPEILSTADPESVIHSLDECNCLLVQQSLITDNFPWAQFCLVVEYEFEENSPWQQLCARQHIRHIGLRMVAGEKIVSNAEMAWTHQYQDKQISLVGSQKVTKNTELLQLLEARHNIMLVERDYTLLLGAKHLYFSDLDVDANTAIIFEDLNQFGDDCMVQALVTKMAALSLKYLTCWFILYSPVPHGSYLFPGHVMTNLSKLQAAVANFLQHKELSFDAKVIFCLDVDEVASVVRHISEDCMASTKNEPLSQWLDRSWLKHEMSQEEKVLLMLPCVSSFSAQLLITRLSMKEILSMSVDDIQRKIPEMDVSKLKILKHLVNSNSGLDLREDPEECNKTFPEVQENGGYHPNLNDINCNKDESEKTGSGDFQEKGEFYEDYSDINYDKFESQNTEQFNCHNKIIGLENFKKTGTDRTNIDQSAFKISNSQQTLSADGIYNPEDIYYATKLGNRRHIIEEKVCDAERKGKSHISSGNFYGTSTENTFSNHSDNHEIDNQEISVTCSHGVYNQQNKHGNGWGSLVEFDAKNENCKIKPFNQSLHNTNNSNHLMPVQKLNNLRREQINHTSIPVNYYEKSGKVEESSHYFCKQTRENLPEESNMISQRKPVSSFQLKDDLTASTFIKQRMEANPSTQTSFGSATQSQLDKRSNMFHNVEFQSKATFDYNHGLPFEIDYETEQNCNSFRQMEKNVNQLHAFKRSDQPRNTYSGFFNAQNESYLHKPSPEMMFPSAEEIDRLVSLKSNNREPSEKIGAHSSGPEINKTFDIQFQPEINDNLNHMKKSVLFDLKPINDVTSTNIKESSKCGTETVKLPLWNTNNNQFYVNPNIGRITQKLELSQSLPVPHNCRSLEDDLRETTRNYLANAQQFSRFEIPSRRHPLQKVSIGLAQPLVRQSNKTKPDVPQLTFEENQLMARSPWATDNSPPMDLDYESSQINGILFQKEPEMNGNRAVYTGQTPTKKRKLTYQIVPGKKGQTKLVFK